ncbi:hypothetical protein BGW36DRAFT_374567 [Talaromyces proteolyticus]|uniref:Uncharacterized protein n=1 Tax=Talaromyces proteolyticus TaxID=1131652 RepID=A0AAD4KWQ8_9EURO|nr:uncharacterized protein BGW36DRAFT_374567 [Talaromyces proteolyticus]KAH8700622.1 hypothetical protein BGW36DRAFT_374567 [Talaromyces proteolyticus]
MEVVGFHLESMQQYFQDLRNRFISSNKIASNDSSAHKCCHSGPWQKDFGLENCDVCGRWMPLYTLSCPSCQIKACISCKYH